MKHPLILLIVLPGVFACQPTDKKTTIKKAGTWADVQATVATMNKSTTYADVISAFGKPYSEFETQSLVEEYVLYFDVPQQPDSMFWIMLDTPTKHYLYWSESKQIKN